jgi:hypothetical protein
VKDDEKPDELPLAFKPFIAAQAIRPVASSIAQATKMRDLIPAFKPFIASEAMRSHVSAINATNWLSPPASRFRELATPWETPELDRFAL